MIFRVHVQGAYDYDIGDEIWQQSLAEAITAEAETIAGYAGSDLLESPHQAHRDVLRHQIILDMTSALIDVGDEYGAPEGVRYTLLDESAPDPGRLSGVSSRGGDPVVEEVLRFEDLPPGAAGSRRAIVRWSDGTENAALTFYDDLCGHPHKSSYAEAQVMPRTRRYLWSCPRIGSRASP
jgi:hypothetical protein